MWWMRSVRSQTRRKNSKSWIVSKAGSKPPGGLGERATHDQQVSDVHRAEQVDRREVGLEEGVGADPVRGQLVGVGVDDVERRVGGQRLGDPQQRVGGELVVVVEEAGELALAERQGGVGRGRDAAVLARYLDLDPRVLRRVALQQGGQLGLPGAVVDDAELPVGVDLAAHRLDRLRQVAQVGPVGRHRERDRRPRGQRLDFLRRGLPPCPRPVQVQAAQPAPQLAQPPQQAEEARRQERFERAQVSRHPLSPAASRPQRGPRAPARSAAS